jgi:predicted alpha/beta-fold hydrolase
MHFRNCSGEPNRARQSYTGGETGDLDWLVGELGRRFPGLSLAVVGFSLGANVLLKWLGEQGAAAPIKAAAAISPPFDLGEAARRLERGTSRAYGRYLVRHAKASYAAKFRHRTDAPVPMAGLPLLKTFREFDHRITAPLHGYASADDYYRQASSRRYLPAIRVPTRVLHARDDPFTTTAAIPRPEEIPDSLSLELSDAGGHVGFVTGALPWLPRYWAEEAAVAFLVDELLR